MASTHELTASSLFGFKGFVAVVTGGGSGIGLMAAQTLAANGAKVYIVGRDEDKLQRAIDAHSPKNDLGGQIIACKSCDVTKKADLEKLVSEIEAKESKVNLLVAAAGVSGPKAEPEASDAKELKKQLWENEDPAGWAETYNTDVTAVYFTTVAFLPLLQAGSSKHGHLTASVIVISSMSGMMRHAQGHFSYNAAKAATVHLSKLMSAEFQKARVRVNSIAPGYFPSEMTAKESNEEQKSHVPAEKIQEKGHVPAERAGADEEMAMAVLFLAKNAYVNGVILTVDGGVLNVVGS